MKLLSPKNDLVSGLVEERKKQYLIKWNKTERKKKQNKTKQFFLEFAFLLKTGSDSKKLHRRFTVKIQQR